MKIIINPEGNVRHVHVDALIEMDLRLGDRRVARASHVEPDEDGYWTADLSPVGGPVLGPFVTRAEALACELNWIERNDVPVVRP